MTTDTLSRQSVEPAGSPSSFPILVHGHYTFFSEKVKLCSMWETNPHIQFTGFSHIGETRTIPGAVVQVMPHGPQTIQFGID